MSTLPTNYVDAVLNAEVNTRRRFNLIDNGDGTVSLEDVTDYTRVGSNYGAQDINNQNAEINQINANLTDNNKSFNFGYDPDTGKYGYYKQEGGSDTFYPFSSGDLEVSVVEDALQSTTIALDIGAIYLALYATGNHGTGELKFNSGATLLHEVYIAGYTPSGTGVSCYCRIYMATSDQGVLNSKTTRITDTGSGRKLYKINVSSS